MNPPVRLRLTYAGKRIIPCSSPRPGAGSTSHTRGKAFLTRCSTCKMLETHSLSPHSGVSRRCPPTETFTPCSGCSGLGNPPEGFKPVYQALPQPEASAPPVEVGGSNRMERKVRIPHSGLAATPTVSTTTQPTGGYTKPPHTKTPPPPTTHLNGTVGAGSLSTVARRRFLES